jgi:hypothetical protein
VILNYPAVKTELETIAAVAAGMNLGRCGDGEAKIACGQGYAREPGGGRIAEEMREFIRNPHEGCIVGIPQLNSDSPKLDTWLRNAGRFMRLVDPLRTYYSAFVSRPDSAPWINTSEFIEAVHDLWRGKNAVVVCERKGSMHAAVRMTAAKARHIECPTHEAHAVIDELEREVAQIDPDIAVLSAGPTATLLANRLVKYGVHAIDLGSAGKFLMGLSTC